jgi:hypothetical protein
MLLLAFRVTLLAIGATVLIGVLGYLIDKKGTDDQ